jgi:hypothetical protein
MPDIEHDATAAIGAAPRPEPIVRLPMLSRIDAHRTAAVLLDHLGEVAVAAAVLRAQEAQVQGRYRAMADWRRIAEAALSRAAPGARPGTAS